MEKDVLVDIMHSVFQRAFDKVERLRRELRCHSIRRNVTSRITNFLKTGNRRNKWSVFTTEKDYLWILRETHALSSAAQYLKWSRKRDEQ